MKPILLIFVAIFLAGCLTMRAHNITKLERRIRKLEKKSVLVDKRTKRLVRFLEGK